MDKYLTSEGLLTAALVFLALAWGYNLISTARTNIRNEHKHQLEPVESLRRDMISLRNDMIADRERIGALERDLETHSGELRDLHNGQTELCRGVQALLEFSIHNGNEEEMKAASASIGKWLRNR